MEKLKHIMVIFVLAGALLVSAAPAKEASVLLQEGLYAEEVDGNLDAAIKIYEQVIQDGSAQRSHVAQALYRQGMCYLKKQQEQQAKLVFEKLIDGYGDQTQIISKAKPLLQGLGSADPAALMPPDTLIYVEVGSPGKQVDTILNMLKGTPIENPLAAIGGTSQGEVSPQDVVAKFLNPNMMAEFKKVRGIGVGITGFVHNDSPAVIMVLFPGKSDALRGLIAGGLAFVGKPVEAVEGMQVVEFTDGGGAAYDDTVVILASPPAYSAGQLAWCVKQYKGISNAPSLASSNKSFARINKEDRQENALTVWANVDQAYTTLIKLLPEGEIPQEILKANSLADFGHVDDVIAFLTLEEDGIAFEANVGFEDGHNGLAYNLFRTPKLSEAALEAVPSDAIGLLSVALGGADSPQSQAIREHIRNAKGIDIGGDVFVNIEQITLFAIPSIGASAESLSGVPPIFGSLGLALRSPNPRQTRQILTGVLTAVNLISSQSASEDTEQNLGRYQIELVNKQTIHCFTDQQNKTTVLSLNPNVIEASVSALRRRQSAVAGGPLQNALNELSSGVSKLALINIGGAMRTGRDLFLSGMEEPKDKVNELIAKLAKSYDKTTVRFRTLEESDNFNVRAEIRDLPPASEIFGPMVQLSQMISEANNRAWAEKRKADVPANIRKANRPVVIDGRVEDLWSEAREYKIGNVIYMPASSDADLSANYKTMWDENNLYVLVNVTDDSLKNDSDSDLWYQDDCVEVFIDADNSKSEDYGDNDGQYHFDWDRTNPSMDRFQHGRTDGVEFAMVTTGNGYRTEIKFPWSTLGANPSAGAKIGLDVHVNDDDDGGDRDSKMTWCGKEDNAWQTPRAFGTAELAGLIGWWKLDETQGSTASSSSGNNHSGKLVGNPQWRPSGGKVSGALEFDGVDDYVDTGYSNNLSAWTVAVWVKSPASPSSEAPSGPVHREKNYQINWNHSMDAFRGAAGIQVGGAWYAASFGPLQANTWYHLVATYDGESLKAYRDGVLITNNSDPAGLPDAESETLKIGRHATATDYFRGIVDDVRIYNYALGEGQIKSIYNEGK